MIDREMQALLGRIVGILVALGIVLWIASQFRGCEPETPEEKHRAEVASREFDAILASQEAVRRYLEHPYDAKFPWAPPEARTNEAGDGFWLLGTVQAPNDFGAMLTHRWGTIVVFDGDKPEVLMVAIEDKTLFRSPKLDKLTGK